MNKLQAYLMSAAILAGFGGVIYYGLDNTQGDPTEVEPQQEIPVAYRDQSIDVRDGVADDVWGSLESTTLDMVYQVTVAPWPKKLVPAVDVKAFHDKESVYVRMQWKDETEGRTQGAGVFTDKGAVMFPLGDDNAPSVVMMGFLGKANIWLWKASQDLAFWGNPEEETSYADWYNPFEDKETLAVSRTIHQSAVNDLLTKRVGTLVPKDDQTVEGRGVWDSGTWQVVFKRSLKSSDIDSGQSFVSGAVLPCAFAVWNGAEGDRGGRKSISGMINLIVE